MRQRRVVITGFGVVSPLGNDPHTVWNRLRAGDSRSDPSCDRRSSDVGRAGGRTRTVYWPH